MIIDNITYQVKEENIYKTKIAKRQIIIASSLRKDNNHIKRLLHKDYGKTKRWNTYTISRDGIIYQHYDDKLHSDFLNIKEADKQSISIVLENMGSLYKLPEIGYVNWLNEICNVENVIEKKWLTYNYWENYTDKQIENLLLLCKDICERHNIPRICVDFNHYHKDIIKFRGIVFRGNYAEDSSDISPLFDIQKFNEMLRNEFI
jgi:N-acetyl-anhydromuramyl-L-alanine amidase AmpD